MLILWTPLYLLWKKNGPDIDRDHLRTLIRSIFPTTSIATSELLKF